MCQANLVSGLWLWFFGTSIFLFVFLQRGLKSSIRICLCPLQACSQLSWSPLTLFTSKLSCCISYLSPTNFPAAAVLFPFPQHSCHQLCWLEDLFVLSFFIACWVSRTVQVVLPVQSHPSRTLTSPKRNILLQSDVPLWNSAAFSVEKQDISFLFWFLFSHFSHLPSCC